MLIQRTAASTPVCVENRGQRPLSKSSVCLLCEMRVRSALSYLQSTSLMFLLVFGFTCQTVSVFGSTAVPATFKVSLKSQEAEEGNSVTLRCELSKKGLLVQWQREAQVLSEEMFRGKYQMKVEGKVAQITILDVQPEDAGKYSCIIGDEKTTAEVKVKRKFEDP